LKPYAGTVSKHFTFYVLALHRGLRQGELLGLRWEDVDLEAGTLQVRRTLSLTKIGHVFKPPKNGKGRSVELTQGALDALRGHLARQLEEIEALRDGYQDQGLMFPGERGQAMSPYTLTGKLERILKRIGLPKIRFHDLRHTCATLLLSKGVHPKFVQELLGHATISNNLGPLQSRHTRHGGPDEEGHGRRAFLNAL